LLIAQSLFLDERRSSRDRWGQFLTANEDRAALERDHAAHDGLDDAALERVMQEVPRGALALSGLTVGLMLLAWLWVYAFIFLPRGMVG